MKDIYFDENYGKLYEKVEKGEACTFKCETENGIIKTQFIKRAIPTQVDGKTYYDIVTPYGYGGPYIEKFVDKDKLLKDYERQFSKYCKDNDIIAEFVRFHPLFDNAKDFESIYDVSFNRNTLATNIRDYDDPFTCEFSRKCRKMCKQVLNSGVTYKITKSPESLEEFKRIYYLNMERKHAEDYYFFDNEYFDNIQKYFKDNILLAEAIYEGKTVAAGLYFSANKLIHAHLSGTDTEYLYLSPAYILKYGTVLWAKQNGYDFIHYGGGVTTSKEDSLYQFKKKFCQNTEFDFYIGKKIWNEEIYNRLCEIKNVSKEEEYFPAYRKKD